MDSIEKADMYGNLDRIAMSKMISNYAINVMGLTPDTNISCNFSDVETGVNEAYDNGVTKACQLGLMGQGIKEFRPFDYVTRAEFATVLSRLLNSNSLELKEMNSSTPYYKAHMDYLTNIGIIDNTIFLNEDQNEIRGYVLKILMISSEL